MGSVQVKLSGWKIRINLRIRKREKNSGKSRVKLRRGRSRIELSRKRRREEISEKSRVKLSDGRVGSS